MKKDRTVRLCGLKFKRQCPMDWSTLEATDDARARRCATCDREVYLCESDEETMWHAEQGHCIARAIPSSSELPMTVVGEPDADWLRAHRPTASQEEARELTHRERSIGAALDNLRFTKRRCIACGYPVATWWASCRVCGSTEYRDAVGEVLA